MTLLLAVNIEWPIAGATCKLSKRSKSRPYANTDEHVREVSRESLTSAMRERVGSREGMVALSKAGVDAKAIGVFMGCSVYTVRRWIRRGAQTDDLRDLPRSGCPAVYTEEIALKMIAFYCQIRPLPGCGRWTLAWAAAHLVAHPEQIGASPSKSTIHRILQNNKLKPHLSIYFLQITDPNFFPKMEHLLALYKSPPANLYFFDECPGIQVLKRLAPDLQTNEMKIRLEEFEYIRNGTMDVFAFLNHADGKVYAECHSNHETSTFLSVFRRQVALAPASEPLHYVMDNLSCHRGYPFCELIAELSHVQCPSQKELDSPDKRVAWLQSQEKRIVIHYTPYHGSWLNMVEIWFGIMGRKVLGESFGSATALKTAFEAFVEEQWNGLLAHPFKWSYDGNGLHEKAVRRFTKMLADSAETFDVGTLIKMLALMTNLLNDCFHKVPVSTWELLFETATQKDEVIVHLIEHDEHPRRKRKAKKILTAFRRSIQQRTTLVQKRTGQKRKAVA